MSNSVQRGNGLVTSTERSQDTEVHDSLKDVFVLDSTVHAYNIREDNWVEGPYRERVSGQLAAMLMSGHGLLPDGDPKWSLSPERFAAGADPEMLGRALFRESDTDMCIYHGVPLWGMYKDGVSPLWAGKAMQAMFPGRVELYGPVSPWEANAVDEVQRLVEEDKVIGIKMYPMDILRGEIVSYGLDDPEIAFPVLEAVQRAGLKVVGTHKAIPQGQVPRHPFDPSDVAGAASAFPDLNFEIVHGGAAYLEETAWQVQRFPNVYVNLEQSSAFMMVRQPTRFAHLLGQLLFWGGEDRIFWSSGATARHPQPFLTAFWNFEISDRLQEEYGYPPLTRAIKEKILGKNQARMLGWDLDSIRARLKDDGLHAEQLEEPWSVG